MRLVAPWWSERTAACAGPPAIGGMVKQVPFVPHHHVAPTPNPRVPLVDTHHRPTRTPVSFAVREHYENDQEILFDVQRPSLITGIEDVVRSIELLEAGPRGDDPWTPLGNAQPFRRVDGDQLVLDVDQPLLRSLVKGRFDLHDPCGPVSLQLRL